MKLVHRGAGAGAGEGAQEEAAEVSSQPTSIAVVMVLTSLKELIV
jgi:hypothetical protein